MQMAIRSNVEKLVSLGPPENSGEIQALARKITAHQLAYLFSLLSPELIGEAILMNTEDEPFSDEDDELDNRPIQAVPDRDSGPIETVEA